MTLAKSRSRNRYQFYIASVDSEMRRRRELEKDLREALALEQFSLVYQPQISYRDLRVVGTEALIRWHHPEHGLVPPDLFIPWPSRTAPLSPSVNGYWTRLAGSCANGTTRASSTCAWRSTCRRCNCTTPNCRGW